MSAATVKLGYRQKHVLELLRASTMPLPTGYIIRRVGADPRTVHLSLARLAGRGLVVHVSHGKWAAA